MNHDTEEAIVFLQICVPCYSARTMRFSSILAGTLLGGSALMLSNTGCGASFERLYESDVRFERCYRLDADTRVSVNHRQRCWSEWAQYHSEGQPKDRVNYALNRERALLAGESQPVGPLLAMAGSAPIAMEPVPAGSVACPVPTSAYEPPPKTLVTAKPPPAVVSAPVVASSGPALTAHQECVRECGQTFTKCATDCTKTPCYNRCGDNVKRCISLCL